MSQTYIDDDTGATVDADWWPEVTEYALRGVCATPRQNAPSDTDSPGKVTNTHGSAE